jgi:hypothetical protein
MLASFRGSVDEMIVGVDRIGPWVDSVYETACNYADKVIFLESPQEVENNTKESTKTDLSYLSYINNYLISLCSGNWILMPDANEYLASSDYTLLNLDSLIPDDIEVCYTYRRLNNTQYAFPMLFKKSPNIRFKGSQHKVLTYPEGTPCSQLPQIITLCGKSNKKVEKDQDKGRTPLLRDWVVDESINGLIPQTKEEETLERYMELVQKSKKRPKKYQAKMVCAVLLSKKYDLVKTKEEKDQILDELIDLLGGATVDDWSRIEHFVYLGDIYSLKDNWEAAYQMYKLAVTRLGQNPVCISLVSLSLYSWQLAQRLAIASGELCLSEECLHWAKQTVNFMEHDAKYQEDPNSYKELIEEAKKQLDIIEQALDNQ